MFANKSLTWILPALAGLLVFASAIPAGAQAVPLAVTTTTLPVAEVGVAYSQPLAAEGGVTPYAWSLTAGALPAGVTLNTSTGVLAGTPTASGSHSFTVQVADAAAATDTQALSIEFASPVAIDTAALADGQIGVAYLRALTVSGGVSPYAWSISAGTLPAGLALGASTGVISGTPTVSGASTFTVRVVDGLGGSATRQLALSIATTQSLTITTSSLPAAKTGAQYSQTLSATGGVAPLTWALIAGSLPAGLALESSTGVIAGTPVAKTTAVFAVTVTDGSGATAAGILVVTVKQGDKVKPDFDARVLAACDASLDGQQALNALCDIYLGGQIGAPAAQVIGKVILKLAERDERRERDGREDRAVRDHDDDEAGFERADVRSDLKASAKLRAKAQKRGLISIGAGSNARIDFGLDHWKSGSHDHD